MASGLGKRFGFARKNTEQGGMSTISGVPTRTSDSNSGDADMEKRDVHVNQLETELEANRALKELERKHRWDPNLPSGTLDDIDEARHAHDMQNEINLVDAMTENSPYPEVRAAVRNVSLLSSQKTPFRIANMRIV